MDISNFCSKITLPTGETVTVIDPETKAIAERLDKLEKENKSLKAKIAKLEDDVHYYKSRSFQDKLMEEFE